MASHDNSTGAAEAAIRCRVCDRLLPLRAGKPGEPVTTWVCNGCGATQPAVLDKDCSLEICQNVRPAFFDFDRHKLSPPPNIVVEAVRSLMETQTTPFQGTERRPRPRTPIAIAVPTLPLDGRLRPIHDPLMMLTRNISCGGIALIHTQPLIAEYLAVELPMPDKRRFQVVAEVLRVRLVDSLYEYGGRFVTKTADRC